MVHRVTTCFVAWLVLGCLLTGCGAPPEPADWAAEKPQPAKKREPPRTPQAEVPGGREAAQPQDTVSPSESPEEEMNPTERRSLADPLDRPADSAPRRIASLPRMRVDDARASAAGIRKLSGKRLTLYTDMQPGEEIRCLPEVFDLAFPQWCKCFEVDADKHPDWKMTGFLIEDKARFRRAGLMPESLPPFHNGFSRNHELWLHDQPSSYYRRHLLLHEGTHGFMNTILGGCGPPWYMEGIAELLATHRWRDGRLTLNHMPAERDEVPHWGRIRLIKDAIAEGRSMRLRGVIRYPIHAHLETEPYAWCWAAATLLDRHPRYRDRFRQLYKHVLEPDFRDRFDRLIGDDWEPLREEWQLLIAGLEYGHDVARTAVDFMPGKPLPTGGDGVTVAADRGWQNSGLRLDGGVEYRLRASGRYQVADRPQIWWCEPGGVSIRYYRGRPLGILLAAVRPDRPKSGPSALLHPTVVGLAATLAPEESGTLYLRINDSAAELHDNAGELKVEITPQ